MRPASFRHVLALTALPLAAGALAQARDDQPAATEPEAGGAASASRLVTVSVDLDETGAVTRCAVTASSGEPALDAQSCDLVQTQGRYEPVLDEEGRPVPATIVHTLSWSPAEAQGQPPARPGIARKDARP